jgi:putative phage-type endonuclease
MKIINVTQGSEEWLKLRLGKITGTRLKAVMGSKAVQDTLIYELVAEQLSGQAEEIYVNNAMRWGTEMEDEAVTLYESLTGVKTSVVGFCVSDEFPYLALSPDRFVKSGKKQTGKKYTHAVEVKAPSTKTVIKYRLDGGVPPEYHWQVVCYFLVNTDLQTLDFLVYDPRIIREDLKLTVVKVTRKELDRDIDSAKAKLVAFHERWKVVYDAVHNSALRADKAGI